MACAIKCDRCGKFEEGTGVSFKSGGGEQVICTKCQKEFKEWWDKGKKQD